MLIITLQRNKCIGCNYCTELSPIHFSMSKKDGKSVLLHSLEKNGFFTLKTPNDHDYENSKKASKACPIKIIKVTKK
ncbi:MAG: ferredoxin [Candidatus Walczuchella monophlebidarum]